MSERAGAIALLQDLLRFDTSNPPGNERGCVELVESRLEGVGIATRKLACDPERPNLLARIEGRGAAPPLLLYGHVDVVPALASEWRHPPFEGVIADGAIWGRGALDMKAGVALISAAAQRLAQQSEPPPGDVIVVLTSDEEAGSRLGMRFLVEGHSEHLRGVRHAFGEVGGMTMWIGERRVTPVQIAEKQRCVIRATARGQGGHAATALRQGAAGELGHFLSQLDTATFPFRVTGPARRAVEALARVLGGVDAQHLRGVLEGRDIAAGLRALGELGETLEPLLRDTATVTVLGGNSAANVVPTGLYADLDVRILPGGSPEGLAEQLRALATGSIELEILHREPEPAAQIDLSQLDLLADVIAEHDADAPLVPWMLPGYTDARYLSRLGIQTYGFLPLRLPREITLGLMHAPDERVPVDAVEPGVNTLVSAIERYRG